MTLSTTFPALMADEAFEQNPSSDEAFRMDAWLLRVHHRVAGEATDRRSSACDDEREVEEEARSRRYWVDGKEVEDEKIDRVEVGIDEEETGRFGAEEELPGAEVA